MDLHGPGTKSCDRGHSQVSSDLSLPSVDAEDHREMSVPGENPPQPGGHRRTGGRGPQPGHRYRVGARHRWPRKAAHVRLQFGGRCSFGRCSGRRMEPRKGNHRLSKPELGSLSLETSVCLAGLCAESRTAPENCTTPRKHSCCPHNLSAQGNCDERVWWRLA